MQQLSNLVCDRVHLFLLLNSQSQLEIMEKSLSPEELQEFSQSILLDGKEPCNQSMISQGTAFLRVA